MGFLACLGVLVFLAVNVFVGEFFAMEKMGGQVFDGFLLGCSVDRSADLDTFSGGEYFCLVQLLFFWYNF